jgi:hypothetical protein
MQNDKKTLLQWYIVYVIYVIEDIAYCLVFHP